MTVSKNAAMNLAKAPRRKEPAEGAAESTALQMGELSDLLGYSLKRAQLKVFEDFLRPCSRLTRPLLPTSKL